jgi:hypothetical protein
VKAVIFRQRYQVTAKRSIASGEIRVNRLIGFASKCAIPHAKCIAGFSPDVKLVEKSRFRLFSVLGPGLITGAADDDPSGIATYSIAGAQIGTALLWTAVITWPLMGCAIHVRAHRYRHGSRSWARLRQKIPRWMLIIVTLALFCANSINVGSDLSGMADAAEMLTGLNSHWFVITFGCRHRVLGRSLQVFPNRDDSETKRQ